MTTPFILNAQKTADLLDISPDTLERYRKNKEVGWIQGVHWNRLPGGDYRYNAELLRDWFANLHDPEAHQHAIENFRASLPSRKRRRMS
jgi:hypothetical protein